MKAFSLHMRIKLNFFTLKFPNLLIFLFKKIRDLTNQSVSIHKLMTLTTMFGLH